jgi:tRNA(fMet)-specific endonuclease VapC
MPTQYLLDTNVVSYLTRIKSSALHRRITRVHLTQLAISTVTEGELLFGLARRPEATRLAYSVQAFLAGITILPWDSRAAQEYANLRADLERHGQGMGNLDMMIAAQALAENLTLVTNDAAFRRIKRLKTEDWTRP